MNVTKELLARLGCTRQEFDAMTKRIVELLGRSDEAVEQAIVRSKNFVSSYCLFLLASGSLT